MADNLSPILIHKNEIDSHLRAFLTEKKKDLSAVNALGTDAIDRLVPFVTGGKTIRGSLVVYSYSLFHTDILPSLFEAGAALELLHAGLLIHDDVMDKDTLRRGLPTIHEQYTTLDTAHDPHFGISMAINAADLCFFLGYELLPEKAYPLVSRELQSVAAAQMQDVESGNTERKYTREQILSLYRYKTARYTFSLPMSVGATLAQAPTDVIALLDHLGESLGLLYQIRDDELSAVGDSHITGKSTGSDERNKKQTLAVLTPPQELDMMKSSLRSSAEKEIQTLPITTVHKEELTALLEFCLTREK